MGDKEVDRLGGLVARRKVVSSPPVSTESLALMVGHRMVPTIGVYCGFDAQAKLCEASDGQKSC